MEFTYDEIDSYEEELQPQQIIKPKIKYRAGFFIGGFLVGLAIIFDLVEIILSIFLPAVGGYIKDAAEFAVFPFLFWIFKIPFWKGNKKVQKITTAIITAIISLIPIISDVLPELTIGVIVTIIYSRVEDKLGLQGRFLQKNPSIVRNKRVRNKIRG